MTAPRRRVQAAYSLFAIRYSSQDKIARHQRLQPRQLDLEVGAGIAVDVAIDDGLVVGGAG